MTGTIKTTAGLPKSAAAFQRARCVLVGGVNSPVRAYKAIGCDPPFIREGRGARVTDLDGRSYVDYICSYGPLILGHAPPPVVAAVADALGRGVSFGMPTEAETRLAEIVVEAVPSVDMVRFVNSGTEAVISAIRLARAATGRSKIIKCTGCYHGHGDGLLVEAGSGAMTLGVPSSPGVPAGTTADTVLVPFNDPVAVAAAFGQHPDQIAAMIVEPVAGNMGCIRPKVGYLEALRQLCDKHGALLLFDEVMTGFRVAFGGAQEFYAVLPDLTCLGKVLGGGLPCAAYGGRQELMCQVAPAGPVYQAGTLSGNPLAMAAGTATLEALQDGTAYAQLEQTSSLLVNRLGQVAADCGVPVSWTCVGSMVGCLFSASATPVRVERYDQAIHCDTAAYGRFCLAMLKHGVLLPPSQFETWFVSTAHCQEDIDLTVAAAGEAFKAVAAGN